MRFRLNRLRWWLVDRIAPVPVITDPYPGEYGVIVMGHDGGGRAGWMWAMKADTFELKAETNFGTYEPTPYDAPYLGSNMTFSGTVKR